MASDPSRINDPAVRALSRQLVDMQRRLDRIEKGSRATQLGRSSIDDGYLLFTDGNGNVRGRAGKQVDGKFGWGAVNGDPPPRPNTPQLVGTTAGFNILWNGEFAGIKPSDLTYTIAYASPAGDVFIVDDSLIVGRLLGAGVIPVTAINGLPIDSELSYWVRLVSYNSSGVASEESFTAGPVQSEPVVATEILDGIVDTLALADDAVTAAKIAVGQINAAHVTFTAHDIGGITTYYQTTEPVGTNAGDLWADSDDGNKLYRFDGADWVLVQDEGIAQAILDASQASSDAADATAAVATKITTFYAASAPTATATGDLWIETDQGNRLHRWDGDSWELVQDTSIAAAVDLANDAQATADGKVVTFAQTASPTAEGVGDLWIDTDDDNKLYRWSGSAWAAVRDDGIGQAIADAAAAHAAADAAAADAAQAISDAAGAQATADGKVDVYYQASAPVGASTGDLWIDTDDDSLHRWSGSAWAQVQDADIAQAIADAGTAQSTADGKITAYYQDSAPGSADTGDLWYDTDNGNKVHRWDGASWAALQAGTDAIADDAITSPKVVAEAIQALHIAAEQIFASHIAADQITGAHIQTLAIVAGHIAANAIQAGHITAGAVTADKLEAILVLASQIIAGDPADWHLELGDAQTPILYWNGVETGFAVSRDQATGQANVYLSGRVEFGNGSQIEQDYLDLAEQPASGFQEPSPRQVRHWIQSAPSTELTARWQSATQKGSLCLIAVFQVGDPGPGAPNCSTPAGAELIYSFIVGSSRITLFQVENSPTSRTAETFASGFGSARWAVVLAEYSGIAAAAIDVFASDSGTGTTASSGTTATTTQADELQFAVFGSESIGFTNGSNGQWNNPTNGFTKLVEGDGTGDQGIAAFTKNATGTAAASTTVTPNKSVPWMGIIATFKSAVAAGEPPQPRDGTLRVFARERAGFATPHVIDDEGAVYPVGRVPYCMTRLNAPAGYYENSPGVNVLAAGDWIVTADPYSLIAIGGGGTFTNITIPVTGIYLVTFTATWQNSTNTANPIVGYILRNGTDPGNAADVLARDARRWVPAISDGSRTQAVRTVPLTAGDVLYWGTWQNAGGDAVRVYNDRLGQPTEMSVAFLGPT